MPFVFRSSSGEICKNQKLGGKHVTKQQVSLCDANVLQDYAFQEKKYYQKHAWRISTSPLETVIFQEFGADSLESKMVRILKILSDTHLYLLQA